MSAPDETLKEVSHLLDAMENDYLSISEYVQMLVILTTHSDAEGVLDGIHRLLHQIDDHVTAVGKYREAALEALKELQCA